MPVVAALLVMACAAATVLGEKARFLSAQVGKKRQLTLAALTKYTNNQIANGKNTSFSRGMYNDAQLACMDDEPINVTYHKREMLEYELHNHALLEYFTDSACSTKPTWCDTAKVSAYEAGYSCSSASRFHFGNVCEVWWPHDVGCFTSEYEYEDITGTGAATLDDMKALMQTALGALNVKSRYSNMISNLTADGKNATLYSVTDPSCTYGAGGNDITCLVNMVGKTNPKCDNKPHTLQINLEFGVCTRMGNFEGLEGVYSDAARYGKLSRPVPVPEDLGQSSGQKAHEVSTILCILSFAATVLVTASGFINSGNFF